MELYLYKTSISITNNCIGKNYIKWTFIRELQKFTKKEDFLLPSCNVSEQTKLLFYNRLNLLKQSNIDKNPTVLINGRILSEYYSVSDFKYILNDILETNEI